MNKYYFDTEKNKIDFEDFKHEHSAGVVWTLLFSGIALLVCTSIYMLISTL